MSCRLNTTASLLCNGRSPPASSPISCKGPCHVHPTRQANRPGPAHHGRRRRASCAAPSASATPPSSIRSCCSTTSATTGPSDYLAGFPWHPHRGIETITYVLAGTVEHGDSLGNRGTLGAGDVQWMTAGSGILHQEMPKGDAQGRMHGFQLWANLPVVAQDDRAALPGRAGARHPRGRRRRRHARARDLRRLLGQARPGGRRRRRSALPRRLGAAGQAQDAAGRDLPRTRSPTCSRARARSATRPQPSAC